MEGVNKNFSFPIGATVQLKYEFGDVYLRAWGGSLATVEDIKFDEYGFEKVYVAWRTDDWRYNSQNPGWSYATHFELKELPTEMPEEKPETPKTEIDDFMQELQSGIEAASGSEGFAIFVAKRVMDAEGHHMMVPEVFVASHSTEADTILGLTIQEHLGRLFQEMSMTILELFADEPNDDDGQDL